ncbi:hypothetical protein H0H87_012654 [Tephrocybe sp. NHM501043]|nr:hypothetical protein H0H87_012654 [Tephrocybe sp. NHM501043]
MAKANAANIAAGKDVALDIEMTASILISAGLNLEAKMHSVHSNANKAKINTCIEDCQAAQAAIVLLGTILQKVGWKQQFLKLEKKDIHELSELKEGVLAGQSGISWIWHIWATTGVEGSKELFQDTLHVEWCKSQA